MKLSVIMPVLNGELFLKAAIDSILSQTFNGFEFIIVKEYGTSPESEQILSDYNDKRLCIISNPSRYGISKSLNVAIDAAKGEYIARMDADDIALPHRFEKQIAFLDKHKNIDVCGAMSIRIDANGRHTGLDRYPLAHERIKSDLLFFCSIRHPTVMFRKSANIRYDEAYATSEDYELWCREIHRLRFANMPDVLLLYRWLSGGATQSLKSAGIKNYLTTMDANFKRIGLNFTDDELEALCSMTARYTFSTFHDFKKLAERCAAEIMTANDQMGLYDRTALIESINQRFCFRKHQFRQFAALAIRSILKRNREAAFLEQNGFVNTARSVFRRF